MNITYLPTPAGGDRPEMSDLLIHPDQVNFPVNLKDSQGKPPYDWHDRVALAIAQELTEHPQEGDVGDALERIREQLTKERLPWDDPAFISAVRAATLLLPRRPHPPPKNPLSGTTW